MPVAKKAVTAMDRFAVSTAQLMKMGLLDF
jgi:hypothetical protein